jgi:hypothetical protein
VLKGHLQSRKSHKINQELDGQPVASPVEKASEEHDYDAGLDRTDEYGYGFGTEEFYAERLEIYGAVRPAASSAPAIDWDWPEHAKVLPVVRRTVRQT